MVTEFLGAIWRNLPGIVRRRAIALGHRRFAVTAGAVILDDAGRILLLDHVFRPASGWGIPGGFLTKGEQPEAALRRELKEEIGIDLEAVELLCARTLREQRQVEICFRARAVGQPQPCSFEIRSAAWFAPGALPPELSKEQRRVIEQALALCENGNQ